MTTTDRLPTEAPGAWPLLGHIPLMARSPLDFFQRLQGCGPVVRIRIGSRPAYVVTRPDLVRRLLTADQDVFDKGGTAFEKARIILGNGLATCPAADHAQQRPLLQPAFHHDRLQQYAVVFRDTAAEITGSFQPGRPFRLDEQVRRIATLAASRTLVSADQAAPVAAQISRAVPDLMQGVFWRMLMPGRLFPHLPLPLNRRFDQQMARTRAVLDPLVSHYRASKTDYGDLLSMVVAAFEHEKDPQQAVYDQVLTILMGAVETTASTVLWTLRLLDQHPHVAERMLTEIRQVLGERLPDHGDVARLPYTRCVMTETLRLYPPLWLLNRITTAPVAWSEGSIPAGADVYFSPYALHRDGEVFADPDRFDPDRWSPQRVTATQRQAFFALGAGRRKCIGDTFGMTEATIATVAIVNRWKLRYQDDTSTGRPALRMVLLAPPTTVRVEPR
ncbi:cytochrome P450 [Streptomyces sp. NPDC059552]|uniref:cytochrome P450 n=1 Tax=Streptomyces sp. NPDC059552 TaxID=3346862 RepID=UPI0036910DB3